MIDRNQVKAELTMRIRFASGGTTPVSGALMENALELLEKDEKRIQALEDEITKWMAIHKELVRKVSEAKKRPEVKFSRWVKPADHAEYVTAGGDPIFCCKNCGGSYHVHGVEHPEKKLVCDNCGCINLYPWEKSYDETNSDYLGDMGTDMGVEDDFRNKGWNLQTALVNMMHMIGMWPDGVRHTYKRHGKIFYRPYRNRWIGANKYLDYFSGALGITEKIEPTVPEKLPCYRLTNYGLRFLGRYIGVTIYPEED